VAAITAVDMFVIATAAFRLLYAVACGASEYRKFARRSARLEPMLSLKGG
jgi:hypothetical protein